MADRPGSTGMEFFGPGDPVPGASSDGDRDEKAVRRGFWRVFRRAASVIPFAEDLVAAYYCALDPATPRRVRLTLLAALAYFVAPFDLVPDVLAGIGFTDDVTVLMGAISMVAAHILPRHRDAARGALRPAGEAGERPE